MNIANTKMVFGIVAETVMIEFQIEIVAVVILVGKLNLNRLKGIHDLEPEQSMTPKFKMLENLKLENPEKRDLVTRNI